MRIEGYTIKEQIHRGLHSHVYRARREKDKSPVIIKTIVSEYPSQKELDRFCNQYNIIKDSDIRGIIKAYELIKYKNGYAIVMEDIGATDLQKTLKGKKLDLKPF